MTEHDDVRRPSAPADAETGYPGQGLGRPQDGPGSIPSLIRRVGGLCIDWGIAVALAWALRDERVTSLLVGARTVEQLDNSLDAVGNLDFTAEELERIDQHAVDAGINLWKTSSDK